MPVIIIACRCQAVLHWRSAICTSLAGPDTTLPLLPLHCWPFTDDTLRSPALPLTPPLYTAGTSISTTCILVVYNIIIIYS